MHKAALGFGRGGDEEASTATPITHASLLTNTKSSIIILFFYGAGEEEEKRLTMTD